MTQYILLKSCMFLVKFKISLKMVFIIFKVLLEIFIKIMFEAIKIFTKLKCVRGFAIKDWTNIRQSILAVASLLKGTF